MTDDWQQNHELREMANAGYGDLRAAIDPSVSTVKEARTAKECILTGFSLIASGDGISPADLLPHQNAMLAADKIAGPEHRIEALKAAFADLQKSVGMQSDEEVERQINAVLATIALSE